jgi:uncharacterized membrane protein
LARIEKSIEINAPPEKLWPMVFWDRVSEIVDVMKKAEYTKGQPGVGAIAHIWCEVAGSKDEWDAETTEWIVNEKHAWRTIGGSLTAIGSMTYTPTKGGTNATFIMDYDLPYSILGKLMDKVRVSKDMNKSMERAMKKLKEIAER